MKKYNLVILACLLSVFLPLTATAQDSSKYVGKVLTQRVFYYGSELPYDEQGHLLKTASACSWTLCAKIKITEVHAEGDLLKIKGDRLFLTTLGGPNDFDDIFSSPKWHFPSKDVERELRVKRAVEIKIQRPGGWDEASIENVMSRIFLPDGEKLAEHVPLFWRPYVCKQEEGTAADCGVDTVVKSVAKVGGDIKAPKLLKGDDPNYIEIAKIARFQGTTVLWIIVSPQGRPSNIRIVRAIGLGLDDMAAATVTTWRFQPATQNGVPVAVQINVEVNFRLY